MEKLAHKDFHLSVKGTKQIKEIPVKNWRGSGFHACDSISDLPFHVGEVIPHHLRK